MTGFFYKIRTIYNKLNNNVYKNIKDKCLQNSVYK